MSVIVRLHKVPSNVIVPLPMPASSVEVPPLHMWSTCVGWVHDIVRRRWRIIVYSNSHIILPLASNWNHSQYSKSTTCWLCHETLCSNFPGLLRFMMHTRHTVLLFAWEFWSRPHCFDFRNMQCNLIDQSLPIYFVLSFVMHLHSQQLSFKLKTLRGSASINQLRHGYLSPVKCSFNTAIL